MVGMQGDCRAPDLDGQDGKEDASYPNTIESNVKIDMFAKVPCDGSRLDTVCFSDSDSGESIDWFAESQTLEELAWNCGPDMGETGLGETDLVQKFDDGNFFSQYEDSETLDSVDAPDVTPAKVCLPELGGTPEEKQWPQSKSLKRFRSAAGDNPDEPEHTTARLN